MGISCRCFFSGDPRTDVSAEDLIDATWRPLFTLGQILHAPFLRPWRRVTAVYHLNCPRFLWLRVLYLASNMQTPLQGSDYYFRMTSGARAICRRHCKYRITI